MVRLSSAILLALLIVDFAQGLGIGLGKPNGEGGVKKSSKKGGGLLNGPLTKTVGNVLNRKKGKTGKKGKTHPPQDESEPEVVEEEEEKEEEKQEEGAEETGEQSPTDEVKEYVEKHKDAIKNRANLKVESEQDRIDFENAAVRPLGFIQYETAKDRVYLIRVIIGEKFIVHIKITVKKKGPKDSSLTTVIPDLKETDKINKDDFP